MDSGPDKTDSDWRARPSSDVDDGPRRDDSFGESEYICPHVFLTNVLCLCSGLRWILVNLNLMPENVPIICVCVCV